ncbi:MAG: hypothetical protein Q8P41_21420 [Pseudomonadota bacterium]|nr:hypothetical protein [Pseudomonadota bacterium]
MYARTAVAAALSACLLSSVVAPTPARAADIASTVVSIGGAGLATAGIVMMSTGKNASVKKRGKIFMIVGLAVSGAASSSLAVLTLLLLATYDKVETVEREAIAGGGPLTDALGAAFGVPRQEVLASVRAVQARQPLRSDADARAFADQLLADLGQKARVSDTIAQNVVFELHTERSGGALGPRHQQLAELAGVSVDAIAPIVAAELDRVLAAEAVPGAVISARAALATNADHTLDTMLDRVVDQHGDGLEARIQLAIGAADAARP